MKKRVTSILLGLTMLLTLIPIASFAAKGDVPAEDPNYIVVQKTLSGINASQIPCNFTVTVKGNCACYVLTDKSCGNIQFSKSYDGLTWTWKINNATVGSYTVSESNASIENFDVQSSGTGSITVSAAKMTVNLVDRFTTCSHKNWPVKDGTFFAAALTQNVDVVITQHSLSSAQRATITSAVQGIKGPWNNPVLFYSVDEQMANGPFKLNGAEITYKEATDEIWINDTSSWSHVATLTYDVEEAANNPEIALTNSYTVKTTSVSGAKTWKDANDQDGVRPDEITVDLLQNGDFYTNKTVTEEDGWAWTFSNLPICDTSGNVYTYTVDEEPVDGYTPDIQGYNITNTHEPKTTSVAGEKTWEDADNQDGLRPDSITINLYKDNAFLTSAIVTATDGWAWSFDGLDVYRDHGIAIVYTIVETAVPGYTPSYDDDYNVTNTHEPSLIDISVEKVWEDADDQDGLRPDDVTIQLLANGNAVEGETLTLSENNSWTDSFTDLDEFAAGEKIVYTIEEVEVDGYDCVTTGNAADGFTVTNTHEPSQIDISVEKVWQDADDQDGLRPDDVTIQLLANGNAVEGETLTLSENNSWIDSFTDLDEFAAGEKIVYTIEEVEVDGYDCVTTGNATEGFTVTNTHEPSLIDISVSKAWDDANNQDGIRPDSITVQILANGQVVSDTTLVLSEQNKWAGSFEDLDEFAAGEKIVYTVQEVAVDGYTATITGNAADGFAITNSHTPTPVVPVTDDNSNIALWGSLMAVSACGMAVLLLPSKKKEDVL